MAKKAAQSASERVSVGVFPAGISYADRAVEVAGDYKRLAFLPFSTLILEWHAKRVLPEVRDYIIRDAAKIQARRGQEYRVSTAGQTVWLGGKGAPTQPTQGEIEREVKRVVVEETDRVMARQYEHSADPFLRRLALQTLAGSRGASIRLAEEIADRKR